MRSLALVVAVAAAVPLQPAVAAQGRAVLVGSNQAGPGQAPLRWADADAERMRSVLVEIGGFLPEDVEVLSDPDADELLAAIDRAAADLADAGDATRFVFYYSGHARSRTLSLGSDELTVEALNARLQTVHARQRLAVLDACQAGEANAPKGVASEAAFSFVSVAGLSTTGTAVVASSTANELSQESERLGGSMFTHHWVTALRGAADLDGDGMVTLDEAYGYAYDRTVVETAATAIGTQHPTIRIDLRGHGDWVLTQPSAADGQLVLPEALEGEVTVIHRESGNVVAEVAKLPTDDVALALVPGDYEILVRVADETCVRRVVITAGETVEVAISGCKLAEVESGTPKAAVTPGPKTGRFEHRVAAHGRLGTAFYSPYPFVTGGGEVMVHFDPLLAIVAGVESYATKQVLPPEIQLSTGIYAQSITFWPMNLGVVYQPMDSRVQPYLGADAITVQYYKDEDEVRRAWGGRLRLGLDVLVIENFGFNVNGTLGAWSGRNWARTDRPTTNVGAIPQLSTGIFLAL